MNPAPIRVADDIKSVLEITKEIRVLVDQVEVASAVRLGQKSNASECCLLKSPGQSS